MKKLKCGIFLKKTLTIQIGELCTWFDKLEFCFLFFPFIEKIKMQFPVVKVGTHYSLCQNLTERKNTLWAYS